MYREWTESRGEDRRGAWHEDKVTLWKFVIASSLLEKRHLSSCETLSMNASECQLGR